MIGAQCDAHSLSQSVEIFLWDGVQLLLLLLSSLSLPVEAGVMVVEVTRLFLQLFFFLFFFFLPKHLLSLKAIEKESVHYNIMHRKII